MKITTDFKWKDFVYRHDVPHSELVGQFDYQTNDVIDGYFKYRGVWYHLDQFVVSMPQELKDKGWSGFTADSYFSGVAIEVSANGEQYRVATVTS